MSRSEPRFPPVEGSSLAGTRHRLPGTLAGEVNLLLVAFQQRQQADVDTWLPLARELGAAHPGLRTYELPVISRGYRLVSGMIDGGMRAGIPDPAVREATITLYIDKSPFRRALAIATEDDIAVLLVDRSGTVLWRAVGPLQETRSAGLRAAVEEAGA